MISGLTELAELVVDRTIALSVIPAPPGAEARRAATVAGWWRADQLAAVTVDAAGNVRARLRPATAPGPIAPGPVAAGPAAPGAAPPAVLVCAHLDTVFGPQVRHGAQRRGRQLAGPGVADNTVAVCALGALDALLPPALRHPVWAVATTGEEGLGNLAGVRALLADPPGPVRALIALEGDYLGRVTTTGVGSVRWRVTVTGPGGHAWADAAQPSAVHEAARLITGLAGLAQVPGPPKATVNIGRAEGGESVNSRAGRAEFLVDLRSDDPARLAALHEAAARVLATTAAPLQIAVEVIGERPAGGIAPGHPLVAAATGALAAAGLTPQLTAASTDANAAYPLGIPAVTVGVTTGGGTHTEQEWIDLDPVATGLATLAATISRLDEQEW
jgi:tripeptide aminopeptidase